MGKEHSEDDIRKKMLAYKIRVTTRISGVDKNKFMLDLLKKGINEAELAKNIINIHYAIIDKLPKLRELEFDEIKKYLIENIKSEN
jgi:hypothetical protein